VEDLRNCKESNMKDKCIVKKNVLFNNFIRESSAIKYALTNAAYICHCWKKWPVFYQYASVEVLIRLVIAGWIAVATKLEHHGLHVIRKPCEKLPMIWRLDIFILFFRYFVSKDL